MAARERDLFRWLDRLDQDDESVVTSVRQPAALREALRVACELGMDATVNDATVRAVRDRLETFAQRLALEAHYAEHPEARPSLADIALAAAELDSDPLADDPVLLRRAAGEVVRVKPDATADDVLIWAAALRSARASA
ncbi:MAG TPA: hypothetical protein VKG45_07675 [Actinomycetes bacterium]|nr:hypothetical protein [Actinomycetes bacterium]